MSNHKSSRRLKASTPHAPVTIAFVSAEFMYSLMVTILPVSAEKYRMKQNLRQPNRRQDVSKKKTVPLHFGGVWGIAAVYIYV